MPWARLPPARVNRAFGGLISSLHTAVDAPRCRQSGNNIGNMCWESWRRSLRSCSADCWIPSWVLRILTTPRGPPWRFLPGTAGLVRRLETNEGHIRLEIQDNGRGLPQERLKRLAEGAKGSGAGLAGMRERFRELGGRMEVQSGDKGTRLNITTPILSTAGSS